MNKTAELSVIIPAYNEAARLPVLLAALQTQQDIRLQIIVADGASADATAAIATQHGALLVSSRPNRAAQMNAAARKAQAPWLLFLHADSRPTHSTQLHAALSACAKTGAGTAGHFPLQFVDRPGHSHRFGYRYMEEKSALNRPYCQNGDQGLLIAADWFSELGGFDESLPYFEDLRLAERIHAQGHWLTLPGRLQTSARRFEEEGWLARYRLMGLMIAAHGIGLDAFFQQARDLYQQHDSARPLRLSPYLELIARLSREMGWRERWRYLYRLGRFARQHWWQLWFRLDVALRPVVGKRNPALEFYDRLVYPLIANPLGDALTAGLVWLYGMGWLRLSFAVREYCHRQP